MVKNGLIFSMEKLMSKMFLSNMLIQTNSFSLWRGYKCWYLEWAFGFQSESWVGAEACWGEGGEKRGRRRWGEERGEGGSWEVGRGGVSRGGGGRFRPVKTDIKRDKDPKLEIKANSSVPNWQCDSSDNIRTAVDMQIDTTWSNPIPGTFPGGKEIQEEKGKEMMMKILIVILSKMTDNIDKSR